MSDNSTAPSGTGPFCLARVLKDLAEGGPQVPAGCQKNCFGAAQMLNSLREAARGWPLRGQASMGPPRYD